MYKKIIKIFLVLIGLGIIIYLAWFFLVPKPIPEEEALNKENAPSLPNGGYNQSSAPQGQNQKEENVSSQSKALPSINKISTENVLSFWYVLQTDEIKYISFDGTVWSTKTSPNKRLTNEKINGIKKIIPYKDGSKVLVNYTKEDGDAWLIYNSLDDYWSSLPFYIETAFWGNKNTEIFAIIKENNKYNLSLIDLEKALTLPITIISNFYFPDAEFRFVPPHSIIIIEKPSLSYKGAVWSLNIENKTLQKITEQAGMFAKLTENGKYIIYSLNKWEINYIAIINIDDLSYRGPRGIFAFANKCNSPNSGTSTLIFCFNSSNIDDFKKAPDYYLQKAIYSLDNLYVYNIKNDDLRSLFISGTENVPPLDGVDPIIRENRVYFINRLDNSLYQISIPEKILEEINKTEEENSTD
jgi:hypothetical protein